MFGYVKKKDVLKLIDSKLAEDRGIYQHCQNWMELQLKNQCTENGKVDEYEFNLMSNTAVKFIEAASQLSNIRKQIEDL